MAPVNIKIVGNKQYEYYDYYDEGRKVQKYCGPAGSVRAKRKALEFELEHMEKRIGTDQKRVEEIQKELGRITKE